MIATEQRLEDIADELGISRVTYHAWLRRGCPRGSAAAAQEWRDNNIQPRMGGPKTNARQAGGTVQEAILLGQAVKLKEDARGKKLKNDMLERKLVYRDEASLEVTELVNMIRTRLESAPDEIISDIPSKIRDESELERIREIALERMKDKVFLILTELSQWKADSLGGADV